VGGSADRLPLQFEELRSGVTERVDGRPLFFVGVELVLDFRPVEVTVTPELSEPRVKFAPARGAGQTGDVVSGQQAVTVGCLDNLAVARSELESWFRWWRSGTFNHVFNTTILTGEIFFELTTNHILPQYSDAAL